MTKTDDASVIVGVFVFGFFCMYDHGRLPLLPLCIYCACDVTKTPAPKNPNWNQEFVASPLTHLIILPSLVNEVRALPSLNKHLRNSVVKVLRLFQLGKSRRLHSDGRQ